MQARAQTQSVSPVLLVADVHEMAAYLREASASAIAGALHGEATANGADIVAPPPGQAYAMRQFQVCDYDSHQPAFAHDISGRQANG